MTSAQQHTSSGRSEDRRGRRRVLAVVGMMMLLAPFTIDMYLPALPQMADDLEASPARIQLLLTGVLLGLAVGQMVAGPFADRFGRRRPVLVGLSCHIAVSLLCFVADDALVLAGLRVLQGLSVSAVSVVSIATVRDLSPGAGHARVMSRMFLFLGVAPVIAPGVGGVLLQFASWRGIFLALAALAGLLLVVAFTSFPETLDPQHRAHASGTLMHASYVALLRDRAFLALIVAGAMMFSTFFAYVAGAPFVLQERFGLAPTQFAGIFAAMSIALTLSAQFNPLLINRFGPGRVLIGATTAGAMLSAALLALLVADEPPLAAVIVTMAASVACYGLSMPNSQALALARHGHQAGTAAALMGFVQFAVGSVAAPMVGLGGADGVAMASVMLTASTIAAAVMWGFVRGHPDTMSLR